MHRLHGDGRRRGGLEEVAYLVEVKFDGAPPVLSVVSVLLLELFDARPYLGGEGAGERSELERTRRVRIM